MTISSSNGSLVWLFGLIFLLSLPLYYLITQHGIVVGYFPALVPLLVALIFTFLQDGSKECINLLKRYSVKIPNYFWYIPTILLAPAILLLADRLLAIFRDVPAPVLIVELFGVPLPVLFILFLIAGSTEEIAWMGYIFDRIEDKWKTVGATLILAIIWVAWHVPGQYLLGAIYITIVGNSDIYDWKPFSYSMDL